MNPKPTLTIRTAVPEDAALLARIGAKAFTDYFGSANTPENMAAYLARSFGEAIQAAELADPGVVYLIAEQDGREVGYAKLKESRPPQGVGGERPLELERLYALDGLVCQGIGSALMRASLNLAAERGCDVLWLGVWERNLKAQAFYRRWGFVACGTHVFVLGDEVQTDYHMQRPVGSPDYPA